MKVFGLRSFERKMNELSGDAGDAGSEGGFSDGGMSDGGEESESYESEGPSDEDIFKGFGLDAKKYGFDKESQEANSQEDSQGSDENEEVPGQEADEKSILELANSLGAIHGDSPIKIESKEQLKNLVQMGHDYTQKTQALSTERKAFDSEKVQAEQIFSAEVEKFNQQVQQFDSQMRELQQWKYTMDELKSGAPDLFDEIQRAYSNTGKQFDNPVLNQKIAALEAKFAETQKGLDAERNQLTLGKFDTEKQTLSSTEQSLKELGITVDWDMAKKEWASTGLPLSKVIGSMYFEQMAKATASKNKVQTTQKKVGAKPVGVAGAARSGSQVKAIDPKLKGLSYAAAVWDRYNKN